MGALHLTATLVARGPAAAVILDEEQVATSGEGKALSSPRDGRWVGEAKRAEIEIAG